MQRCTRQETHSRNAASVAFRRSSFEKATLYELVQPAPLSVCMPFQRLRRLYRTAHHCRPSFLTFRGEISKETMLRLYGHSNGGHPNTHKIACVVSLFGKVANLKKQAGREFFQRGACPQESSICLQQISNDRREGEHWSVSLHSVFGGRKRAGPRDAVGCSLRTTTTRVGLLLVFALIVFCVSVLCCYFFLLLVSSQGGPQTFSPSWVRADTRVLRCGRRKLYL